MLKVLPKGKINFIDSVSLTITSLPDDIDESHFSNVLFVYGMPLNICPNCNGIVQHPPTLVFSIKLVSNYESTIGDTNFPFDYFNIQIGPWRFRSKANLATDHKSFVGSIPYSYHRLIRKLPKCVQTLYGHIECPGIEHSFPLAIPLSTPIFIYGENYAPFATGEIVSGHGHTIPLLQRATLIGHPYKIHQKSAVIKGMFHSVEDVEYFSPVELVTISSGQKGYIKESLGTHGLMKVCFNRPVARQEPVCMYLFKQLN